MAAPLPQSSVLKPSRTIPLRLVLVLPFFVLISTSVGLVGYFSFKSGHQAVAALADQLLEETGNRIQSHLESYLGKAQAINQSNLAAVQAGTLDLNNFNALGKLFHRQVQLFTFAYMTLGGADGSFIGAGYIGKAITVSEIPRSNPNKLFHYETDDQGNRLSAHEQTASPETNSDPWYVDAVKAGKPTWSSIYTWVDLPDHVSISATAPIYNRQRQLLGVMGIDLELAQISKFLQTLNNQRRGTIFILERSGFLVASSENESPTPIVNGKALRLAALKSQEPLIRDVTRKLMDQFGSLAAISQPQRLRPDLNDQPFVQVTPYRDAYGLDWLIVTAIPESEFMKEIQANNRITILLCGLTLGVALLLGLITARWIARPIQRLNQASQAIARGEQQQPLSEEIPIAELKSLSQAFNQMAVQVQQSFDRIHTALEASKEKFTTIFHNSPDPISIVALNGPYLEINDSFIQLSECSREEVIGRMPQELGISADVEQDARLAELLMTRGRVDNFEYCYQTKSGRVGTSLISLELMELEGQSCVLAISKDISDRKQLELQLQTALAEKITLLQEVHHRVKNNLQVICSLLRLQKNRIADTQVATALEDSNNRIFSMSLVHQNLYESQNFAQVHLSHYVRSLLRSLMSSYGGLLGQVRTQVEIPASTTVPMDQAVPCGLFLNEVITNAFKHGFADPDRQGSISVTLTIDETDSYVLSVANDGEPLPADFQLEQARQSLGIQLILLLAEQLQGSLRAETVVRPTGPLTVFALRFQPGGGARVR